MTKLYFEDTELKLGDSYLEILARHRVLEQLKYLDITSSGVTDEGVAILAEKLKTNRSLKFIHLNRNVMALAGALNTNTTLTILNLGQNGITDVGAKDLAEALRYNETLTILHLHNNAITDVGAKDLVETLKISTARKGFGIVGPFVISRRFQCHGGRPDLFLFSRIHGNVSGSASHIDGTTQW